MPEWIMTRIRQNLGLEPGDTSRDSEIESMSQDEAVEAVLNWEGIIGYTVFIINLVNETKDLDD